jgi:hypothetical protein
MKTKRMFAELYSFPGFRAKAKFKGVFGDPHARIVDLRRVQKKRHALSAGGVRGAFTIAESTKYAIWTAAGCESTWNSNIAESIAGRVAA